ncbi:ribonuclease HIII [Streptococcus chenjunshii]|uniref:Ribonuclease HIII n=1 Tax=Streptococcus chenjunshii TaxID=2173853 RepID=A0A372KNN6_9STRE|nr:ribonuclease HIII [Streptococcus chenjunshii]AXQ77961.1 ribonuclease HIII [Streptococcus chenjunshii]RFU51795.1 ribonuclease HIII [Streptococcus chenjunshii]RFU53883.1 ribonuclease HIII [Streptococcus chenjunshii]
MSTVVAKPDKQTLTALQKRLIKQQISNHNPYVTFAAKLDQVTILIYTSGKVVFQGSQAEDLAQKLGFQTSGGILKSKKESDGKLSLIGSDEVGNGSYFGGLAVVASFVEPEKHQFLKELGVADSKQLTDSKILQIAPLLEKDILHQSLLLTPQKYNETVGKGKRHNAVSVKVALHNQAIFLLLQKGIRPDNIIIDAFTSPKNYQKYLQKEANRFSQSVTLEEKAEAKYLAVAVSSIIARKLFLENLTRLGQDIGFTLPSGAGPKSDKTASEILAAYGMPGLAHTAKLHFANTQKAQQLLKS